MMKSRNRKGRKAVAKKRKGIQFGFSGLLFFSFTESSFIGAQLWLNQNSK